MVHAPTLIRHGNFTTFTFVNKIYRLWCMHSILILVDRMPKVSDTSFKLKIKKHAFISELTKRVSLNMFNHRSFTSLQLWIIPSLLSVNLLTYLFKNKQAFYN